MKGTAIKLHLVVLSAVSSNHMLDDCCNAMLLQQRQCCIADVVYLLPEQSC